MNKFFIKISVLFTFAMLFIGGAVNAQVFTFTNAGATGNQGPTQGQVNSAYSGTTLDGAVTINTQGIQEWTVPATGNYRIEVYGAEGGGTSPGLGAKMIGEFNLTSGNVLKIAVGQVGMQETYNRTYYAGGGGGGTFVVSSANTPYIIAGGGGGCSADESGHDAITENSGANTGSNGDGGNSIEGGSGAGFTGNGETGAHGGDVAANSFVNNAMGGTGSPSGGT